ncbi:hypothetical protein [Candidatus Venteria ishoeyi]|uniref:BppU N-terminal domain-containing protein n=1 Tax=Candidatus Venteria ishoeyi TaxID=1899563 RepID=A0A1H6F537_9GAMM|nr:hypothetical protein [Candidatus Venteria ishoeyi]SEH05268.1 Uncharacterised protein [Candidatus Venteria ishoeyi]
MPKTYNIENHCKGDTFAGIQFTILNTTDSTPIDLTGVAIKTQFRKHSKTGKVVKEIETENGITITNAVNGVFKFNAFVIDWSAGVYYYDIEFTFSDGTIVTYLEGTLTIIQDVTNG